MAVFASRQIVMPVLPIAVTITGSGDTDKCYATINGTKQYSAGTYAVNAGNTITFGVYGISPRDPGTVTIDGTEVLRVNSNSTRTYDWIAPSGISTIGITMEIIRQLSLIICGKITVTTA